MEGEGISAASNAAGAASAGGAGTVSGGGGFESIGTDSVSIFEAGHNTAPGDTTRTNIDALAINVPIGETPAVVEPEIGEIEAGIFDSVRKEGTPEAGFQFLSDIPIVASSEGADEDFSPAKPASLANDNVDTLEPPTLTPEQKQVDSFLRSNPEMLTAIGQVLSLGPEAMELFVKTLKKALE